MGIRQRADCDSAGHSPGMGTAQPVTLRSANPVCSLWWADLSLQMNQSLKLSWQPLQLFATFIKAEATSSLDELSVAVLASAAALSPNIPMPLENLSQFSPMAGNASVSSSLS